MNLVDSCGWLEYFTGGRNADFYSSAIEDTRKLIVPAICIAEVFKKIVSQRDEQSAWHAVAAMQLAEVIDLDMTLSIQAARIGREFNLPLSDSIILATARSRKAVIWTQDAHFEHIEGVRYKRKK